jgi:hypothetical protein
MKVQQELMRLADIITTMNIYGKAIEGKVSRGARQSRLPLILSKVA